MLLDSCFTVNIFGNISILQDIHTVDKPMKLYYQSGISTTQMMNTIAGYLERVWYTPNGINNVIN